MTQLDRGAVIGAQDVPATPADLCRRWRDQAAEWSRMAATARNQRPPDYAMASRREYRAEVYESCADDLEAALLHQGRGPRCAEKADVGGLAPGSSPAWLRCELDEGHDLHRAGKAGTVTGEVIWPVRGPSSTERRLTALRSNFAPRNGTSKIGRENAMTSGELWYEVESEWEYGCVRCQKYHAESDGLIYTEHIALQSKHGLRRRPVGGWLAERESSST